MAPSRASESLSLSTTADETPSASARSTSALIGRDDLVGLLKEKVGGGQQGGVLGAGSMPGPERDWPVWPARLAR